MYMTAGEIVRSYLSAKNRRLQIEILADLNLCKPEQIRSILQVAGVDLSGKKH